MPALLHWFRRDFRVHDNTALIDAARRAGREGSVVGVFVIDPRWWLAEHQKLGPFQAKFWLASLAELQKNLTARHIPLILRTNPDPVKELLNIANTIHADAITCNKEYEPDQRQMDARLEEAAAKMKLAVHPHKDAVLFEDQELLTGGGTLYSVFTPYKNAYLKKLADTDITPAALPPVTGPAPKCPTEALPTLACLGFNDVPLDLPPGEAAARNHLDHIAAKVIPTYADTRDTPALSFAKTPGTSRISAHLNAGTLSIRQALHATLNQKSKTKNQKSQDTFLTELIWRDFYRMILANHPHTVSHPFNNKYTAIRWSNDEARFAAWCEARTGYPIVDAAMRQLLQTGFMHNRLRMIAAMFLTKDLDIHWTWGERFFMRTLVDYDQACNVGGWQWSASTGTDAAPYFRVMNPELQSKRWDPDGAFLRHYLPALQHVPAQFIHAPHLMSPEDQKKYHCLIGQDYPAPIVDHAQAKSAAIAKFRRK